MNPYILTLSLLTGLTPNAFAQALSEFETFRTFPYLDKGYQAAKQNDWSEVERLMRHALERVPQHLEARGLLVQALTQQQRYAEAARETETLTGTPEGLHALFELRQAWITQHPPAAEVVETWLQDSAAP
jgi:adsorption protein A